MSNNKEINIQAGPGVYKYFRNLDLTPWICLGEFVDNSVGSFLDKKNQKRLKKIHDEPLLEVTVTRDKKNKKIIIKDNACGIHNSEIDRALKIGERPDDAKGLNEFGVGMKMAAFWFSKKWTITTTALGEPFIKQVTFDVDDIEAKNLTSIDSIEIGSTSEDEHWTEIILEDIYSEHWPSGGNTLKKIKDVLSSMYRRFTTKDQILNLCFEDGVLIDQLTYDYPKILNMPYVDNMEGPAEEWRVEVNFETNNKKISGWVGLLDKPSGVFSGFTLFRRDRVIEGQDNSWKPDKTNSDKYIFFSGNAEPTKRLFGELDFSGFQVTNNKNKIDWGTSEENVKELFLEYLHHLIKREKETDSIRRFWQQTLNYQAKRSEQKKQEEFSKFYETEIKDQQSKFKNKYDQKLIKFNTDELNEKDYQIKDEDLGEKFSYSALEFQMNISEKEVWNILCQPVSLDGHTLFDKKVVKDGSYPREISIIYDINHPFIKRNFYNIENFQDRFEPIMEIIAIVCIAEVEAEERQEELSPSFVRLQLNNILKKIDQ